MAGVLGLTGAPDERPVHVDQAGRRETNTVVARRGVVIQRRGDVGLGIAGARHRRTVTPPAFAAIASGCRVVARTTRGRMVNRLPGSLAIVSSSGASAQCRATVRH
jgi:hypothetical protein